MPTVADKIDTVLTVYSTDEILNQTRFECEFTFIPAVLSPIGTLTVMGKDYCVYLFDQLYEVDIRVSFFPYNQGGVIISDNSVTLYNRHLCTDEHGNP